MKNKMVIVLFVLNFIALNLLSSDKNLLVPHPPKKQSSPTASFHEKQAFNQVPFSRQITPVSSEFALEASSSLEHLDDVSGFVAPGIPEVLEELNVSVSSSRTATPRELSSHEAGRSLKSSKSSEEVANQSLDTGSCEVSDPSLVGLHSYDAHDCLESISDVALVHFRQKFARSVWLGYIARLRDDVSQAGLSREEITDRLGVLYDMIDKGPQGNNMQ